MNKYGFIIRKLSVSGKRVPAAQVSFRPGFNVIAGASDTGKSYILQCLDFMFGGEASPKPIKESEEYEDVWLELEARSTGKIYSLRRSLKGGDFALYEQEVDSISPAVTASRLRAKHNEGDEGNISSLLLSLSGFSPAKILKGKKPLKVQNLSFRTITHLILIGEDSIISEKSPIWLESGYQKPASESAFNLVLTGKDDSGLVLSPDPEVVNAKLRAKFEVLDEMIESLEQEAASSLDTPDVLRTNIAKIEERISQLSETISASSAVLAQYQRNREVVWIQKQEIDSRLIVIAELLRRFTLLSEHYHSDLARLAFIDEGCDIFDHLETIVCPMCGASLDEHVANKMCLSAGDDLPQNDIQQGCQNESEKIRRQMQDLGGTVISLQAEQTQASAKSDDLGRAIESIDREIKNELKPITLASKSELDDLLRQRDDLRSSEGLLARLAQMQDVQNDLEKQMQSGPTGQAVDIGLDTNALAQFCKTVGTILKQWRYAEETQIHFDQRSRWMDLVIDGQPRKSHGKGIRALTHSAFNLGLMEYCVGNSLPHPCCVVLDSPLLSLRERKAGSVISEEMQEAFYRTLAGCPQDRQIIVLENKEPPADVKAKSNYIEFSGNGNVGRSGFFPK